MNTVQLALACSLFLAPSAPTPEGDDVPPAVEWNARHAEHLLGRAGFGARPAEIERAVERGLEATVDALLAGPDERPEPWYAERLAGRDGGMAAQKERAADEMEMADGLDDEAAKQLARDLRRRDRRQMAAYTADWYERMVAGADPLRDRMTLFWHGYFTSSMDDVKSSYNLIRQHELLAANALGSFRDLVHGIARDPAMLEYLDNRSNRKRSPNENFARELMELFTLGEGNYTEEDVAEAARAFTGWADRDGEFVVRAGQHDRGVKTVLGREGRFDGADVIDILLDQEACPRHVAGALLAWLEGTPPSDERLEVYAAFLRETDYDVGAFLRRLFLDPDFYREEVVGTRIAGPVDFLVGSARRLGVAPPGLLLHAGATLLGQRLFHPPNVKGWDEGPAWITTSTLMQRGNLAGVLLDLVDVDDVLGEDEPTAADEADEMGGMNMTSAEEPPAQRARVRPPAALRDLGRALERGWRPRLHLKARLENADARTDAEIVDCLLDELLAVEAGPETRAELVATLAAERHGLGLLEGELPYGHEDAEQLLRRLAHLILSLPEAQLH